MKFVTGTDEATELTDAQILGATEDVHCRHAHRQLLRL